MRPTPRLAQLLLAAALLLTLAPISGIARPAMAAETFHVSGAVTGQAGAAVAGATVAALDTGGAATASATTGGDGRYSLAVAAGTYDIQVTPPAGSAYQLTTIQGRTVSADTTIDIALVSASAIQLSGRVLDAQGQGISGQRVSVGSSSMYTDARGAYAFALSPGAYAVEVQRWSGVPATMAAPQDYVMRFTSPPLTADTVFDITLPVQQVRVRVQDPAGNPIANVEVRTDTPCCYAFPFGAISASGYAVDSATTDLTGSADLWLFPYTNHHYTLFVTPGAGSPWGAMSIPSVAVPAVDPLTITLSPAIQLSGRVLDAQGQGISGQRVSVGSSSMYTDAHGAYAFALSPGAYAVEVQRWSGVPATMAAPQDYVMRFTSPPLTADTVFDITLPVQQVRVRVQDPAGNPITNVEVRTDTPCCYAFPFGAISASGYAVDSATTDLTGSADLWLFPYTNHHYTLFVTPGAGSPWGAMSIPSVAVPAVDPLTITLSPAIQLSGRVLDAQGQGISGQRVSVGSSSMYTDARGAYAFALSPGTYAVEVQRWSGVPATMAAPQDYVMRFTSPPLTADTVFDITLPVQQVRVRVQDPAGNPITNVEVRTDTPCCYAFPFGAISASGYAVDSATTDLTGSADLWLFPYTNHHYTLFVTPPATSPFATFSLPNVAVSGNQDLVVALQFIHAPPVTTATATPQPRASGSYPGPVTVALTATSGYTIASTSYSIDGGPTQTYGAPFTISGDGAHTLRYWSTDSTGVYEAPRTLALTIASNRPPAVDAGGPYRVIVGQSITLSGAATDPDGDALAYAWDLDGDGSFEALGQIATFSALGLRVGTAQAISFRACDPYSACLQAATTVAIESDLRITTAPLLPGGSVGESYSVALAASGGVLPYTWSLASGALPPGLSLDPDSGVISGTPTDAGAFQFAVSVSDSAGHTAQGSFGLDSPPTTGTAGGTYNGSVGFTPVDGGGAPATCASYALVAGELPPGLTLDLVTGALSGTPADGGDYAFTIACATSGGQTATRSFSILISNPAPTLASLDPAQAPAAGPALSLTLRGSGFVRSSKVRWGGADRPTTYVSSSELRSELSASDLAAATVVDLTVSNPAPGGGVSNALSFSVLAQPPALSLPGEQHGQYSDPLVLTVAASDPDTAAAGLAFSASGLPVGLTLTDNGDGSATISGAVQAPAGSYVAQISVIDPAGQIDSGDLTFVVAPEGATLSYAGDIGATAGAPLALRALLREDADSSPGDLTHAAIFFDLTDSAGATTSFGPAPAGAAGAASYDLLGGLPTGDYSIVVRLDPAGGFYAAPDSTPASLHVQAKPPAGPTCNGVPATIIGTSRHDVIRGTLGDDVIVGLGGNDLIDGLGGNDLICGGDGNDTLYGGAGNDTLYGGAGNDTLYGDQAGDSTGGDRRHGGENDGDRCHGRDDHYTARAWGDDQIFGEEGDDRLFGDAGNDTLDGGAGKDQLDGEAGDYDQLRGGDGDDRLVDEDGVVAARAGAGRDTLDITLRAGWRDANGQPRFAGALSGGYGDDRVTLTLLDRRPLFIDITGDERDDPPSPLEGRQDQLELRGSRVDRSSLIIKFERQ